MKSIGAILTCLCPVVLGSLIFVVILSGLALSQAGFYEGKTITMVLGSRPGGKADTLAKALIPYLRKYIPGNPTIIMQYSPPVQKAGNYLYHTPHSDGLIIGKPGSALVSAALLDAAGVKYDIGKFIYLGAIDPSFYQIFISHKRAGLNTVEKLRGASAVRIGERSVGTNLYVTARLFAYMLDIANPRFVTGYSSVEVDLALPRGELDATVRGAETILRRFPDWQENLDLHAAIGFPKGLTPSAFAHVSGIETFARSEKERKLIEVARMLRGFGMPLVLPPATKKERVQILRHATRQAFRDPQFQKEFTQLLAGDPAPRVAEELEDTVTAMPREGEIVGLLQRLAGPGPLPPR